MTHRRFISTSILAIATSSMLFLLPAAPIHAQQGGKNIEVKKDSTHVLRNIAVSIDILGPIQRMVSDYGQYEAAVRINLKGKYFPVAELGLGTADGTDEATKLRYKTSAPYARIGCDFNLLRNKNDIYRLYGGLRYALTYYKYDLSSPGIEDPIWGGTASYGADGVKCNYHWMEAVFGVDAKIWGPIRMGWSLRYKRQLFHDDGALGNTWYVPGYGKKGSSRFGGTFNIAFEL